MTPLTVESTRASAASTLIMTAVPERNAMRRD
jgi:hypothetical protein